MALFLPLIREELQISYAQAGVLAAAATLSYALGQIPAGFLADRFGPRRLFLIGLIGWSLMSILLGLTQAFWCAVATQFVAGTFRALLFAPGLTLLASWFPRERGATAMSLYMLGGYTGNILLALVGPALAATLGWRISFIVFAALGASAAAAFFAWGDDNQRGPSTKAFAIAEALRLCRLKVLWICSAIQAVRFSVVTGFMIWLPTLLVADRDFSLQMAGAVSAFSAALAAMANPIGGYFSDRMRNPPVIIGASLAVLAAVCVLLVWVQSFSALLLVIAVGSVFMQLYFGVLYYIPVEVVGQRATGTVIGFSNLFANLGGLVTSFALGTVKDATGSFKAGFLGIGGLCIFGVVLSIALMNVRQEALPRHATKC